MAHTEDPLGYHRPRGSSLDVVQPEGGAQVGVAVAVEGPKKQVALSILKPVIYLIILYKLVH